MQRPLTWECFCEIYGYPRIWQRCFRCGLKGFCKENGVERSSAQCAFYRWHVLMGVPYMEKGAYE